MDELKNRLSELLAKPSWSDAEKAWMLNYLESSDNSELREIMEQQFEKDPGLLSTEDSSEILDRIHLNTGVEKPVRRIGVRSFIAAASVIIIILMGWLVFYQNGSQKKLPEKEIVRSEIVKPKYLTDSNNTESDKTIRLADGSLVILSPNSAMTYAEKSITQRNIRLSGRAYFRVAKDKAHPFTVVSDAIATTALGTEFHVTAIPDTKEISVRLYEGKVVIRALDSTNPAMKKEIFLNPGQEFIYGNRILVRSFLVKTGKNKSQDAIAGDDPLIPQDGRSAWYMFNNQSLEQVLNDLAALYEKPVLFEKSDVENIYFTGKYEKSESLETILRRIATLNNLQLTNKDDAFVLSK